MGQSPVTKPSICRSESVSSCSMLHNTSTLAYESCCTLYPSLPYAIITPFVDLVLRKVVNYTLVVRYSTVGSKLTINLDKATHLLYLFSVVDWRIGS